MHTVCLFCCRALDGRSKKFCTTCLPPLGQWVERRDYHNRYAELSAACGIHASWGFPSCKIPKTHGAYTEPTKPGPIHGPRLTDRPQLGPPKPTQRILRVVERAFAMFPRTPAIEVSLVDGRALGRVALHNESRVLCDLTPCEWCGSLCRLRRHIHNRDLSLCHRCRFIKMGTSKSLNAARRQEAARLGDRITWLELGKRDRWVCHLCNRKVPHKAGNMDPAGATVDHLIPISAGGSHTWDNVALAHRSCNMARNARGTVQLRLIA